ncbi:MAG: AraC family transcriptional regulator [Lachnospiraceae bacterium]
MERNKNILDTLDISDTFLVNSAVKTANIQQRNNYYSFSMHVHNDIEIYFIMNGHCQMEIGNQMIHCIPGDFVIILPNIPHSFSLCAEEECVFQHIHFRPYLFSQLKVKGEQNSTITLLNALEFSTHYGRRSYHFEADSLLQEYVKKIIAETETLSPFSAGLINLYLTELLLHILKIQDIELSDYSPRHEVQNSYVNFTLHYIRDHYDGKILIENIASQLKISSGYLRKAFSNNMHINISSYIQIFRMNKAAELLLNTSMSLTDIAIAVGVNDAQYFSKLFRQIIGISPLKYRKLTK